LDNWDDTATCHYLKIESYPNTPDFILINLISLQGLKICNQNCHAGPIAQPAKNSNMGDIIWKKGPNASGYLKDQYCALEI
jgi:hypothetical protein